jgi:hypothetical protein
VIVHSFEIRSQGNILPEVLSCETVTLSATISSVFLKREATNAETIYGTVEEEPPQKPS